MSAQTAWKASPRRQRSQEAGPFRPMIDSFELHLRAERKSDKTIRIYLEAALWSAAEHLVAASVEVVYEKPPGDLFLFKPELPRLSILYQQ
jgi:hypothetical protein